MPPITIKEPEQDSVDLEVTRAALLAVTGVSWLLVVERWLWAFCVVQIVLAETKTETWSWFIGAVLVVYASLKTRHDRKVLLEDLKEDFYEETDNEY